jgi:hypothetical protein
MKFIKMCYGLVTVVMGEREAVLLYVAVIRLCRDRAFGVWDLKKRD